MGLYRVEPGTQSWIRVGKRGIQGREAAFWILDLGSRILDLGDTVIG